VVRHPVVRKIINAYGREEKRLREEWKKIQKY
jgi:phosphate starvation-inducible protein PhoH